MGRATGGIRVCRTVAGTRCSCWPSAVFRAGRGRTPYSRRPSNGTIVECLFLQGVRGTVNGNPRPLLVAQTILRWLDRRRRKRLPLRCLVTAVAVGAENRARSRFDTMYKRPIDMSCTIMKAAMRQRLKAQVHTIANEFTDQRELHRSTSTVNSSRKQGCNAPSHVRCSKAKRVSPAGSCRARGHERVDDRCAPSHCSDAWHVQLRQLHPDGGVCPCAQPDLGIRHSALCRTCAPLPRLNSTPGWPQRPVAAPCQRVADQQAEDGTATIAAAGAGRTSMLREPLQSVVREMHC